MHQTSSSSSSTSTFRTIINIAKTEGFWGFYGGVMSPLIGSGFVTASGFLTYGRTSAFLMDQFHHDQEEEEEQQHQQYQNNKKNLERPLWIVAASGATAGIVVSGILTPVELIKSRVQVNPTKYSSVPAAFKTTISEEGPTAIFKGLQATLLREIPGSASWFLFYEIALRNLFTPNGKTREDAPWYGFLCSGAIGGLAYWSAMYPIDVVKTKMQVDNHFNKMGFVRTMSQTWKAGGVKALYSGIGITLCRAPIANAAIFGAYELMDYKLKQFPVFQQEKQWQRNFQQQQVAEASFST